MLPPAASKPIGTEPHNPFCRRSAPVSHPQLPGSGHKNSHFEQTEVGLGGFPIVPVGRQFHTLRLATAALAYRAPASVSDAEY